MALRHRRFKLLKEEETNKILRPKNEAYDSMKEAWKKWNSSHYSGKKNSRRKTPWYMMTTGVQYNYEEHKEEYGTSIKYVRVLSEAGKFHNKTIIPKMTRTKYNELLVEAKLKNWEKKHPRPIPKDSAQKDLFEAQFMVPWVDEHTKAREKIVDFVSNIGNRVTVFARYSGDVGYPHKLMSLKSDGSKFLIMEGKYTNYESTVINKVQRAANLLSKSNQRLIALKVVDKSQECIITPYVPVEEQLKKLDNAA